MTIWFMITEAERSHGLSSASWIPGNLGGMIQPESKSLRTKGH